MEIDNERLIEIAEECDTSLSHVTRLYNLIKDVPCVFQKDEDTFLRCLQTLVSDRISQTFIESQSKLKEPDKWKNLKYSVSDALYRYYEDAAIPYLDDAYVQARELDQTQTYENQNDIYYDENYNRVEDNQGPTL